jgi:hypothetical protein
MKAISMSADPTLPRADPVTVVRQLGWTNIKAANAKLEEPNHPERPCRPLISGYFGPTTVQMVTRSIPASARRAAKCFRA